MNFKVILLLAYEEIGHLGQKCIKNTNVLNMGSFYKSNSVQFKYRLLSKTCADFKELLASQINHVILKNQPLNSDYMGIHFSLSYSSTSLNNFFKPLKNHYKLF